MKYLDQGTRKIITENLNSISQVSPSRASYSKKGGVGGHENSGEITGPQGLSTEATTLCPPVKLEREQGQEGQRWLAQATCSALSLPETAAGKSQEKLNTFSFAAAAVILGCLLALKGPDVLRYWYVTERALSHFFG